MAETVQAFLDQFADIDPGTPLVARLPDGRYARIEVRSGEEDGQPVAELRLVDHG